MGMGGRCCICVFDSGCRGGREEEEEEEGGGMRGGGVGG